MYRSAQLVAVKPAVVVLFLTLSTISLPVSRVEASVYLYVAPVIPNHSSLAADVRTRAAGCQQQRVGPLQACKASGQGGCEGDVEKAFRLCLAGIRGVEFWLGVCARHYGCDHADPLFPIPAEQAFDANLNPTFATSSIGRYAATGLSADLHQGPNACVFNGGSAHPSNQAELCAKLYLLLAKPLDPETFAALQPYLDRGFRINTRGEDEETMLHRAIRANSLAMVQRLVARGADPNAGAAKGVTPLLYAAYAGAIPIADFLLAHGARVTLGDDEGATVLHYAVRSGSLETLRYFVGRGADVHAPTSSGATPLHVSVEMQQGPMVDLLLSRGADVNARDRRGWTPLHLAASAGSAPIVKALVAHGAKLDTQDVRGKTPLCLAIEKGQDAIAAYLRSIGARCS